MTDCPYNLGERVEHEEFGVCRFVWMIPGVPDDCWVLTEGGNIQSCLVQNLIPHTPADTVEVRIAVAVDDDGNRVARMCYERHADSDIQRWVAEDLIAGGGCCRVSFVTARVPLPPRPAEVVGEVKP